MGQGMKDKKSKPAAVPATKPAGGPILRYADYLQHEITHAPKRTKGERTKEALKLGAIRVLDDVGYHAMRVSDLCEVAEVGSATFYLYFENKADITLQVLSDYLAHGVDMLPEQIGRASCRERV